MLEKLDRVIGLLAKGGPGSGEREGHPFRGNGSTGGLSSANDHERMNERINAEINSLRGKPESWDRIKELQSMSDKHWDKAREIKTSESIQKLPTENKIVDSESPFVNMKGQMDFTGGRDEIPKAVYHHMKDVGRELIKEFGDKYTIVGNYVPQNRSSKDGYIDISIHSTKEIAPNQHEVSTQYFTIPEKAFRDASYVHIANGIKNKIK